MSKSNSIFNFWLSQLLRALKDRDEALRQLKLIQQKNFQFTQKIKESENDINSRINEKIIKLRNEYETKLSDQLKEMNFLRTKIYQLETKAITCDKLKKEKENNTRLSLIQCTSVIDVSSMVLWFVTSVTKMYKLSDVFI